MPELILSATPKRSHRFGMRGAVSPPKPQRRLLTGTSEGFGASRVSRGHPWARDALGGYGSSAVARGCGAWRRSLAIRGRLAASGGRAVVSHCSLLASGTQGCWLRRGDSVRAALRGEILERERRGWSIPGAVVKLVSTAGRPQPLGLGGQRVPARKQAGAVELW